MTFPQPKQNFARVDQDGILPSPYSDDNVVALTCDDNGNLFVTANSTTGLVIGFVASDDGLAGLVPSANGSPVRGAADQVGREWVRLYQNDGNFPGPVKSSNGLMVQGDYPVQQNGYTSNPVVQGLMTSDSIVDTSFYDTVNPQLNYAMGDSHGRIVSRVGGWQDYQSPYNNQHKPVLEGAVSIGYGNLAGDTGADNAITYLGASNRAQLHVLSNTNPLVGPDGAFKRYQSNGFENVTQITGNPGRLWRFTANISQDYDQVSYVMLFNQNSTPNNGDKPWWGPYYLISKIGLAGTGCMTITIDFGEVGLYFDTGLYFCGSNKQDALDDPGSKFMWSVQYTD